MGDRYRYNTSSGRRSPTYNPARQSMPVMSNGYSSFYGGDIHVIPTSTSRYDPPPSSSSHHHNRHNSNSDWRGPNVSVPVTTTTYTVRKDPVTSSSSVRAHSRHRSSTIDNNTTKRPPIIVTTRQAREPSSSTTTSSSRDLLASPAPDRGRGSYRNNDEPAQYYSQPASSLRSRSSTRTYPSGTMSSTMDNEEFLRLRQRTDDRLAPSWNDSHHRRERPSSFYADPSRHTTTTVDLGDSGYEYTNPGTLARYDLDNDRRHRDNVDRSNAYYRPSVNVADVSRPYEASRRGPPPTTRGLDKVNRRVVEATPASNYDRPSSRMPPVVPVPVPDRRSSIPVEVPPSPATIERRPSRTGHRPVSLYQDGPPRSSVAEDSYRARDDDYAPRGDPRDKEYYRDDVGSRGFGLRTEGDKEPRDRRESRREPRLDDRDRDHRESKRPSDEDADRYDKRYGREPLRKEEESRSEKKSGKEDSFRDKVATSLSLAAGAIGLGGAALAHKSDKEDKEDKGSPRRRDDDIRREEVDDRPKRRDQDDRTARDDERSERSERSRKNRDADEAEDKERNRRDAEAKLNGESVSKDGDSSSDESKPRRRRRPSNTFKPNDTASLMALKEQLKAKEESEKESATVGSKDGSPERRPSPPQADRVEDHARSSKEETRGRNAASPANEEKERQVRVVSPPRDKDEKKPIKGILKQPKPSFPEEPNPVREGVAPHKDDKSKGNVPPGARWTKINRKLVNPEALTIGKERFEIRDDFVIVLRVLSKEEIEAYTAATAQLRKMRADAERGKGGNDRDDDEEDDDEDERRRSHRSHRREPRDEDDDEKRRRDDRRDRDRDRETRSSRRHKYEDEEEPRREEPRRIEYNTDDECDRLPFRSHRHREREREKEPVPIRRDD